MLSRGDSVIIDGNTVEFLREFDGCIEVRCTYATNKDIIELPIELIQSATFFASGNCWTFRVRT